MTTGSRQSGLTARDYLIQIDFLRERVEDCDIYPFSIPAIRAFDRLRLEQPVTFLIGENGSGKSTLMEAIAVAWGLNAEGGSRDFRFTTGPFEIPYRETEHFQVTRRFLNDPGAMLEIVLNRDVYGD